MSEIETEQGWTLNLLNWFGTSGGAMPASTPDCLLLQLPYEIRGMIWRNVPVKDHKSLRLTCEQIKQDVEENVGVNGTLHGPEPTIVHYVVTGVQYLTGSGDYYQGRENAEWLKTVLVRELSLKNLSRMPLLDTQDLLKNPAALTTLSVWLEEEVTGEKLVEIIDQFPSLSTVRILPRLPSRFIPWNPIWNPDLSGLEEYNTNTTNILNDALKTLMLKPVKHLEISMDLSHARSLGAFIFVSKSAFLERLDNLRRNYYIGMQNNAGAAGLLFPTELDTLDIRMPQIRNLDQNYNENQAPLFKSLLDVQTMLTSLKVRIGSIYWRYFENVLQNCYQSLKSLEIDVGNWEDPFGIPPCPEPGPDFVLSTANQIIPIPEEQCFDWTVLFSPNCNLESLTLRMPMRAHVSANCTRNFCLTFANLKKLELEYLKLSPNEFRIIFLELPQLRNVSIREWSKMEDTPENFLAFKEVTDAAFDSIRQALLLERLTKIVLWEEALSGNIYNSSVQIRGTIQHPAYTVQWSTYYLRSLIRGQGIPEDEERYRISREPSLFIIKNE